MLSPENLSFSLEKMPCYHNKTYLTFKASFVLYSELGFKLFHILGLETLTNQLEQHLKTIN